MSAAGSTDPAANLSPLVIAAAAGDLPPWAVASVRRREHIERVRALLAEWAARLSLPEEHRLRWAAAGSLHDALRDAEEADLRRILGDSAADLPAPLLHGPAAAKRLDGEVDESLASAIRYHTSGHPSLDRLGRALYLADFLEPGRSFAAEWRAALRERMPEEMDAVLVDVLASRLQHLVAGRKGIRPETAAMWSVLVGGA